MLVQLVNDSAGTPITAYSVGTITTVVTQGIPTDRVNRQGLLFVLAAGSITTLQRQVSRDNANWYNVYDSNNGNLTVIASAISDSRLIMLSGTNSSNVVAPWTRFTFVGTGVLTTLTLYHLQQQNLINNI